MASARWGGCWRACLVQRCQELGTHHLGNGSRTSDIANRVLYDIVRRFLAVVDLLTVQVDLEPTLSYRCQLETDFSVTSGNDLSCHTDSLPEVPSRNAVLNLELCLAFGHSALTSRSILGRLATLRHSSQTRGF